MACVCDFILFRSSLAKEEKENILTGPHTPSQSGNRKERSIHVPFMAQNYFGQASTEIPDVLTADNYACMLQLVLPSLWLGSRRKQGGDLSDLIDESIDDVPDI
jgi:hypothetical protein